MLHLILLILLLISLLTVFKAQTYHLWLLSVLVTEFSLLFVFAVLILLLTGIWTAKLHHTEILTALAAILLFLSPVFRSWQHSKKLPAILQQKFPLPTENKAAPFKVFGLLKLNRWKELSCSTLSYNPSRGLTLDFYRSSIQGKRPCVVVIHGGSWSSGDSTMLPELNLYLARQGYNVAAINYRKAPEFKNPAPLEDLKGALDFLQKESDRLCIDSGNFVLLGRSAGAQIALLAAYTLHSATIKGVISFYGPADMVWGYSAPAKPLVMDSKKVLERYLGGDYASIPEKYKASSPIEFVGRNSPPTLMLHGRNDVLVAFEHNLRLIKRLSQNEVSHFLLDLPWAVHGFDYHLSGPSGQLSTYAVSHFLKYVTS